MLTKATSFSFFFSSSVVLASVYFYFECVMEHMWLIPLFLVDYSINTSPFVFWFPASPNASFPSLQAQDGFCDSEGTSVHSWQRVVRGLLCGEAQMGQVSISSTTKIHLFTLPLHLTHLLIHASTSLQCQPGSPYLYWLLWSASQPRSTHLTGFLMLLL